MNRREKYPDTATFAFYNANPKNRITGDCVVRAMCTALEEDYNTVLSEMVQTQIRTGYALDDAKGIERYLLSKGWVKHNQPRKSDNTKYTGVEWCRHLTKAYKNGEIGNIVCNIGGHHTVAIKMKNGKFKVHDHWNSTGGCIGNYYTKA